MATEETTDVRIGLHDVARLRWPKEPLTGDGARETVPVPVPRLPWSGAAVEVPLGASAARRVERVLLLRRIFGYGVAPLILVVFVVADGFLILGRFGHRVPDRSVFGWLGAAGVVLIFTGLLPNAVARLTGTPFVSRGQLRFPRARPEAVRQVVQLNPKASIETT